MSQKKDAMTCHGNKIRNMTNNNNHSLSAICFHFRFMLFCMLLFLCSTQLLGAGKGERKVVKIAYQEFNRQMVVDENNIPVSGYTYDYIQTIGIYAGWDIKYIPCESFADSVKLLLAGKVDLIYEISYTEERAKEILYPDEPMGFEYYYLYSSEKNTTIAPDDYASINGKTVGVTSGTMLTEMLKEWCRKKNVNVKIVEYEDIPTKEADLLAGKIDLDLEVSMLARNNLSAVEKIGSSAYYLVANKQRQDLIDDINAAMEKVLNNDLYFFSRLQERYFSDTVLSRNLTTDEKNWLAEHKVLRVGFLDDYLPFSGMDENGKPIGAGVEAINEIVKLLKLDEKLKIEYICFDNQKDGYRAVESGKIDLMFPAYISNSVKHDYRIIGGNVLVTLASDFACLGSHGDVMGQRIGVNRNNLMQYYYTKDYYPHLTIVFYDDIKGCLDGVLDGTSDGTLLNGFRSAALLRTSKYHSLRSIRAKHDFQFQMAFSENAIGLMLLMNRGLTMLDQDFINKSSYSFVGRIYTVTLMDFLQEHILPVLMSVAILVALFVAPDRLSNKQPKTCGN